MLAILLFIAWLPGTVGRRVDRRLAALWIYWVYWAEAARLVSLVALRRLPWQANVAVAAAETSLYASMMTAAAHDSANRGLAAQEIVLASGKTLATIKRELCALPWSILARLIAPYSLGLQVIYQEGCAPAKSAKKES